MNLAPVPANTPQPVLQFTKLNIQIVNSEFSNLVGTPYTLIFNDSLVEFVNTTFTSNTGAPPPVWAFRLQLLQNCYRFGSWSPEVPSL